MKKLLTICLLGLLFSVTLSADNANNSNEVLCDRDKYSNGECLTKSYTIIEVEKYHRGRHNWMKVGDTLNTDIITGCIGAEKRRNLPREAYILNKSNKCNSEILYSK